ncbi:MAG: hypothetical protein JNN30_02540 [Rhodanobacteraceae bacterium]|nr:hypothetical protein [Rhodanobacteraceae bacterium]
MTHRPLPLFRFAELIAPSTPSRPSRPGASASRRLYRLLTIASANESSDAQEGALVLDLHTHLRRIARAD